MLNSHKSNQEPHPIADLLSQRLEALRQQSQKKPRKIEVWQVLGADIVKYTGATGGLRGAIFKAVMENYEAAYFAFQDLREGNIRTAPYFLGIYRNVKNKIK